MNTICCESRAFAKISIDAILHNFDLLAALLPQGVRKMAVVKANAYGHGAVPVARALENKADYFAVACIDEALELRNAGITTPILVLGYTPPARYADLVNYDVSATLCSVEEASFLSQTALAMKKKARIHIAVDTGMGRIGFQPDADGTLQVKEIAAMEGLLPEGIFSHFANADAKTDENALQQQALFDEFLNRLEGHGVRFPLRHICNSAGALRMEKKYDMCRLGISLYGYAPSDEFPLPVKLLPAMTVQSNVIFVKTVEKGTPIGYGHTYVAPERRRIATVAIGYADGYNRCISGKGYVLLYGKKAPIVGRICMDQMMVDVTDVPQVKVGDSAIVLGKSGDEEITADLLGQWANSFSYEVLCTFLPRVQKIYSE